MRWSRNCDRAARFFTVVAAGMLATTTSFVIAAPAHADKLRDDQWHLSFLDVAGAHKISQGEGVTVAVIDTGIDAAHPDLKDNVLPGADVVTGGSGNGWGDTDGHGTGMAGLVAAHGHGSGGADGALGIAPKAKILPIRIATPSGSGTSKAMGVAVDEAVGRGAKIISISHDSGTGPDSYDAIQRAVDAGVIVVAAAGNRPAQEFMGAPGNFSGVVAVGAVGKDGNILETSTRGPAMSLAAPGLQIVSTGKDGAYRIGTGTSPSAAIVAGAAALVWAKYPQLTSTQVVEQLTRTATDKGRAGRDEEYGFGTVDLIKALNTAPVVATAQSTTAGNGVPPSPTAGSTPKESSGNTGLYIAIGVIAALAIIVLVLMSRRRRTAG